MFRSVFVQNIIIMLVAVSCDLAYADTNGYIMLLPEGIDIGTQYEVVTAIRPLAVRIDLPLLNRDDGSKVTALIDVIRGPDGVRQVWEYVFLKQELVAVQRAWTASDQKHAQIKPEIEKQRQVLMNSFRMEGTQAVVRAGTSTKNLEIWGDAVLKRQIALLEEDQTYTTLVCSTNAVTFADFFLLPGSKKHMEFMTRLFGTNVIPRQPK
ncbi:MAG: hypothetical protein C0404_02260 [Verrucomicrobia bacterium]|nr:hypothetical protein [Verrucomicrobiota bacterium]